MDHVVRVELDALEDEVVEDVEGEESGVQEDARVRVRAEQSVVVRGAGEGVQRQHRPADDVQEHLHVEVLVEEGQLQHAPLPQRGERTLDLAARPREHGEEGEDETEGGAAGHLVDGRPVEPVPRQPGQLERPHDLREREHEEAVQPVAAGLAGVRIDDVPGDPLPRQDEMDDEERGADRQRSEEADDRFGPGKLEQVPDAQPFNHRKRSSPGSAAACLSQFASRSSSISSSSWMWK